MHSPMCMHLACVSHPTCACTCTCTRTCTCGYILHGRRILQVRQPAEYRLEGHVAGSVNICAYTWEHGFYLPNEGFADQVAEQYSSDREIVLLCADGKLAKGAAAVLEAAAFTNVQVVEGYQELDRTHQPWATRDRIYSSQPSCMPALPPT